MDVPLSTTQFESDVDIWFMPPTAPHPRARLVKACIGSMQDILFWELQAVPDGVWQHQCSSVPPIQVEDLGFGGPSGGASTLLPPLAINVNAGFVVGFMIPWFHQVRVTRLDGGLFHYVQHQRHPQSGEQVMVPNGEHQVIRQLLYGTDLQLCRYID
jgi:hypothetical protein